MDFRLVATDLDGTLLRSDNTMSDRTKAALTAVAAAGSVHVVVTGRAVPGTRLILDELGYDGIAVCGQGAQVYDAGEHRLLTSVTLDRKLAQAAVAKLVAEIGPVALAALPADVDQPSIIGPGFVNEYPLPADYVADEAEIWAAPLLKVFVQHPRYSDDELTAIATRVCGGMVGVTFAGQRLVELIPLGMSKAVGLAVVARRLGLRGGDALAFGDMPNDIPMFEWAAHSVAVANAHPRVLAAADEVTLANDEDGVAIVLERLLS